MEKFRVLLSVIQDYIEYGNGLTNSQTKTVYNFLSDAITEHEKLVCVHPYNNVLFDAKKGKMYCHKCRCYIKANCEENKCT
jgi:hypothetical protein